MTDGCNNCKFLCREGCLECDFTKNLCLKCPKGFLPESYYCKNICGDGYIANDPTGINNEDCDDMNNSILDGCINCRFG